MSGAMTVLVQNCPHRHTQWRPVCVSCWRVSRREMLAATVLKRFWAKANKTAGCWLWTDSLSVGYGRFWTGSTWVGAHRFAYETEHGAIPDGFEIDHLCRTKSCVRPSHLEAVTHQENGRRATALITHCPQGHEYNAANTYVRSDRPSRDCRTCRSAAAAAYRRRTK